MICFESTTPSTRGQPNCEVAVVQLIMDTKRNQTHTVNKTHFPCWAWSLSSYAETFNSCTKANRGPSSVVSIATAYGLDGPGIEASQDTHSPHG